MQEVKVVTSLPQTTKVALTPAQCPLAPPYHFDQFPFSPDLRPRHAIPHPPEPAPRVNRKCSYVAVHPPTRVPRHAREKTVTN